MTRQATQVIALAFVASMVLTLVAPAAAAGTASELAVETDGVVDVTETTATLQGDLTDLGNATEANVSFTYWVEGDAANASTVDAGAVNETGPFEATAGGLAANTTYVVVAEANASGAVATGENVTFATDDAFDVRTLEPGDVNNTSATLRGELVDLDGAANATVWFEYRSEDDANATTVGEQTLNEAGEFEANVTGLDENETYVYAAYARPAGGEAEAGDEVTIAETVEDEPAERPFGQQVSSYVHGLFGVTLDGPFGTYVSDWVVANNPGADNRPDHAGPDGERGPPDHARAGEDTDDEHGETDGDEINEDDEDERAERGPPEHANDDADAEEDDEDDDDRGNGKGNGHGEDKGRSKASLD